MSEQSQESAITHRGPGRVIIGVYAVFAIAATSRALFQLVTKFSQAPIAYTLSAIAALIYIIITVLLWRGTQSSLRLARIFIVVELIGVLAVGTMSYLDSAAFPRATVWSHFGEGYGFIPLILPIVGLFYLRKSGAGTPKDPA
jgi:riboflavin transporter FmnP